MELNMNPKMETLYLIYSSDFGEAEKEKVISELENIGVEGREFYDENFGTVEKYYSAFRKHLVASPGTRFLDGLSKACYQVIAIYTYLLWKFQDELGAIESITEDALNESVDGAINHILEPSPGEDFFETLEKSGMSSEDKWQLMLLKNQPRKHLSMIMKAVEDNLPAFEKALGEVAAETEIYIASLKKTLDNPKASEILQDVYKLSENALIFPTLALPASAVVFDGAVFFGVFADRFAGLPAEFTKEEFLRCAKVLGEKSKLEILFAVKDGTLYGGELAGKVGLTPATVSHHLNALLAAGFITLERSDGKIYPKLKPQGIQRFIDGVKELIL